MLAGDERDRLLRVAAELHVELGYREDPSEVDGATTRGEAIAGSDGLLGADDELLVGSIRESLARVAAAASIDEGDVSPSHRSAILGALDGAEIVMRCEILAGNIGELPSLIPGFVFLVTLPIVGQKDALDLSRRTADLLA